MVCNVVCTEHSRVRVVATQPRYIFPRRRGVAWRGVASLPRTFRECPRCLSLSVTSRRLLYTRIYTYIHADTRMPAQIHGAVFPPCAPRPEATSLLRPLAAAESAGAITRFSSPTALYSSSTAEFSSSLVYPRLFYFYTSTSTTTTTIILNYFYRFSFSFLFFFCFVVVVFFLSRSSLYESRTVLKEVAPFNRACTIRGLCLHESPFT